MAMLVAVGAKGELALALEPEQVRVPQEDLKEATPDEDCCQWTANLQKQRLAKATLPKRRNAY